MFRLITIQREYGCGGGAIAHGRAKLHPPGAKAGCRPWSDHSTTDSEHANERICAQDRGGNAAASCVVPSPRTYATAGAFRRALEERLKRASLTDQIDLNRLRRQVSFDRLLARLFREEPAPWVLKDGYALELRFKAARSTVDIDLTLQRVAAATSAGGDTNQVVRDMLQRVADLSLGDWFEFVIGAPAMDLTAAPYGARHRLRDRIA